MDELTMLRLMRDGFGPRDAEVPVAVTERVLAEFRTGQGRSRVAKGRVGPGRPRIRRRLLLMLPAAAAVVTVTLVLAGVLSHRGSAPSGPGTPPMAGSAPADMIAGNPSASLDARSILLAAAHEARSQPEQVPDPNSFIYVRQIGVSYYEQPEGAPRYARGVNEIWVSVDGTRPGLQFTHSQIAMNGDVPDSSLPDDVLPLAPCSGPPIADESQTGSPGNYCDGPGFVADIPTSAAGALDYLRHGKKWMSWTPVIDDGPGSEQRRANDFEVFNNVNQLSLRHLEPPRSLAAIYEALAGLPDVQVIPDARTAAGRVGVSVAIVDKEAQTRFELIFDPTTNELIGNRLVALSTVAGERNRVVGASSIIETAVVKAAGLRPDGSKVTS